MKLIKLTLLEPVDCYGNKPDGSKRLIKEATRDAPAIYTYSQLEAYKSTMLVEIEGKNNLFELSVAPEAMEQMGGADLAITILNEFNYMACSVMQENFNEQLNKYMQEHPHAPR